jgi:glycosyl transferase family 87
MSMNKMQKNGCYILLLIAALLVIFTAIPSSEVQIRKDFHHSYVAAHALVSGAPLYEGDHRVYIYPPLYAFLLTPITHFPESVAHGIWIGVSVLLLAIVSVLGLRILQFGFQIKCTPWQAIGACSLTVLLMHTQMLYEFREGQNDILILLGFTLALYWLQRRPRIAGIALGLITDIKYQALVMLPFFLFRARFRTIVGLLLGILAGAFIPAMMIGWRLNLTYLQTALHGFANMAAPAPSANLAVSHMPSILWESNCSITSALARLFYHHGWSIQSALICALILAVLVFFLIRHSFQKNGIPFIWRRPFANPQQETALMTLEWQAVLVCMLVFSPECIRRHLILAYHLNLLAVLLFFFPRPQVRRWPILLAIAFSQLAEMHIALTRTLTSDIVGLPGLGYLIFLLIMIPNILNYYQNLYRSQPVTEPAGENHLLIQVNK